MRGWIAALLTSSALVLMSATPAIAGEIHWYTDLKQASAAAQKTNLPMFIDFWADWCAPCRAMDKEVYPDPRVIRAFEGRVIGVRIHFDLQPDLARKYAVPALPYLLLADSYGTPLLHSRGLLGADDLITIIQAMPSLVTINRLDRALQQNADDLATIVAMGRELHSAGFWESSNTFYDRALKHHATKVDPTTSETVLYEMALNWIELRDAKNAADTLRRWLKTFPNSPRKPEVLAALKRVQALD